MAPAFLRDAKLYESVFDFGCGCGLIARQLLTQNPRPKRYVGIDLNPAMIHWCQNNLSAFDPAFQFHHHDIWNLGLGPDNTRQSTAAFPVDATEFSLVVAQFTHLYPDQTKFYLGEIARILTDDGIARTTWFLFDRLTFPMMCDSQVALFINETDPSNAVIYDWRWLLATLEKHGFRIAHTVAPGIRGHQWELYLCKGVGEASHDFPTDVASHRMLCGSGSSIEGTATTVTDHQDPPDHHLLHFTGAVEPAEFATRCAEVPWWYHSFYFDNGLNVRGDYDIGADIHRYGFPESMEGMRVLDIGTGSGWFAFYFEQLGAEVVTVDARGYCDFDMYGRPFYGSIDQENRAPDRIDDDGTPVYYSPVSRGFWTMKEMLRSTVRFRNARVYDLTPQIFGGKKFDLVFLGAILCHLRDPIGALMAARTVCKHRVIASTPVVLGETEAEVLPRQYLPYTSDDKISWWLPNEACFRHWFSAAGFMGVDVSRHVNLKCDVPRYENGKMTNGDQVLRVGTAFVP
jgi:SAM-dependent methyltransferase